MLRFYVHAVEHADKQVGEWMVIGWIKCQVLSMSKLSASHYNGHVGGCVFVCVSEIASVEDQCLVQKRS